MKNIVVFCLETLNKKFFKIHSELFPNINRLSTESIVFPHYFSTATSTFMVITDFLFGDTNQFEKSKYLEDIYSVIPQKESFVDRLVKVGYSCTFFGVEKR